MASLAAKTFFKNAKDVKRLTQIHSQLGKNTPGRKYGLEVLNKSAIVLITAFWEAYCEDLAEEALTHLIEKVPDATKLPKDLKKRIAAEIKKDQHELAVRDLADKGWQVRARTRLASLMAERKRSFNNPKSFYVDELFHDVIGLHNVSNEWRWEKMTPVEHGRSWINLSSFAGVSLTGESHHRRKENSSKSIPLTRRPVS